MGQQASKLARSARTAAAGTTSSSRTGAVVSGTGTPQSFTQEPSNASNEAGFTRGQGATVDPRDERQRQFLEQKAGGSEFKEMPSELIDFLNDSGPIQRKTATKTAKQLLEKRKETFPSLTSAPALTSTAAPTAPAGAIQRTETSPRVREAMPLAANVPGFDTIRTTSFSHKADLEDPRDFAVGDVLDLYAFIVRKHSSATTEQAVQSFYQEQTKDRDIDWSDDEKKHHVDLLRQTLEYLELPVIMKDTDQTYVGTWPARVQELEQLKLVKMPKNRVQLVLQDLAERKREQDDTAV